MNLLEIEDTLKNLSDDQLRQEMGQPSGSVPQFLILSEFQRRKQMRDRFAQTPSSTVADDIMGSNEPRGIASLKPPMPPMQSSPVKMAGGGPVQHFQSGGQTRVINGMEMEYVQLPNGTWSWIPKGNQQPLYTPQQREEAVESALPYLGSMWNVNEPMPEIEAPPARPQMDPYLTSPMNVPAPTEQSMRATGHPGGGPRPVPTQVDWGGMLENLGLENLENIPSWLFNFDDPNTPADPPSATPPTEPAAGAGGAGGGGSVGGSASSSMTVPGTGSFEDILASIRGPDPFASYDGRLQEMRDQMAEQAEYDRAMGLAQMGFAIAAGESPYFATNVGQGGSVGLQTMAEMNRAAREQDMQLFGTELSVAEARDAARRGDMTLAAELYDTMLDQQYKQGILDIQRASLNRGGAGGVNTMDELLSEYRETTNAYLQRLKEYHESEAYGMDDLTRQAWLAEIERLKMQSDALGNRLSFGGGTSTTTPASPVLEFDVTQ